MTERVEGVVATDAEDDDAWLLTEATLSLSLLAAYSAKAPGSDNDSSRGVEAALPVEQCEGKDAPETT